MLNTVGTRRARGRSKKYQEKVINQTGHDASPYYRKTLDKRAWKSRTRQKVSKYEMLSQFLKDLTIFFFIPPSLVVYCVQAIALFCGCYYFRVTYSCFVSTVIFPFSQYCYIQLKNPSKTTSLSFTTLRENRKSNSNDPKTEALLKRNCKQRHWRFLFGDQGAQIGALQQN